jgi:glycosyltransferase involved in cell wall biosynthesis
LKTDILQMKKVLMIARVFPPFGSVGHSIRAIKFIKYLPALGWLPAVLTVDDQQEYESTRKVGSETLLEEIQPQVKIYRTAAGEPSLNYIEKEGRLGRKNWLTKAIAKILGGARRWAFRNIFLPDRYMTWLPFAVRRGRQIVRSEGIDVIFATCPPHSATLVGACLKRFTGKPLILDYRDDWIDTPWHRSRPAMTRMIERRLERWVVKTADKVILVTEWSKKAFLERYPTEPGEKFGFISNGCDLGDFTVLNSMPAAPHNSKFTIVHAGSLNVSKNWGRSPSGLFQAIHHVLQQQPELAEKLTLVFAGDLPEGDRQLADEMGLSAVIKGLGHRPHDEALRLTKSADLLLAINYEGWSSLIPGKIYEYWAVGGPPILLLSCPGAAASFVEQHGLGFTVDPSDVAGIQQAILTVYRQSETATPLRVSTAGIEAYDRQALTGKLAEVLSMVCDRCES